MKSETQAHLLRLAWAEKDGAYLFPDTVRVECPGIPVRNDRGLVVFPYRSQHIDCICQGRGKVPSTDPMVWAHTITELLTLPAMWNERVHWEFEFYYRLRISEGDFDAAIPHAVKALELSGALLEVANELRTF